MAGLFFVVPGGIFILGALCLCWLADRITAGRGDDHIDTTIEEYEGRHYHTNFGNINPGPGGHYGWRNNPDGEEREDQEIWDDFYGDDND